MEVVQASTLPLTSAPTLLFVSNYKQFQRVKEVGIPAHDRDRDAQRCESQYSPDTLVN